MTPGNDLTRIVHAVTSFLSRPHPILFLGAGVGARVEFPLWPQFVEHLAIICDSYDDHPSAEAIRDRLRRGRYLEAASVYRNADLIPEGERWKLLAEPFLKTVDEDRLDRLVPLVGLPTAALVTTNYDRSLLDAWARCHRRAPFPIERDNLLRGSLSREQYVARVHGSAERPPSMAFDSQAYSELVANDAYVDFIMDLFRNRSLLFIGFSFLDPAIDLVMSIYKKRMGPDFDALHTALIPKDQDALAARLRSVNIQATEYDPHDDHLELWQSLRHVYDRLSASTSGAPQAPDLQTSSPAMHRFLAFAYAQATTRRNAGPVAVIAHDGVVSAILAETGKTVVLIEDLIAAAAPRLGMTPAEATPVVRDSVERLADRNALLRDGPSVLWDGGTPTQLETDLKTLAQGVLDRMQVREGTMPSTGDATVAARALEELLVGRAWDLAAQLAGAGISWPADLTKHVARIVIGIADHEVSIHHDALARAILNLLRAPDSQESVTLVSVARVAFGLQLLMASPRQTLLHSEALPQRIYLDSNIVLPLIVSGHPLSPAYTDALRRLTDASARAGSTLQVVVGFQLLNEVLSHRALAIDTVRELGLDDPNKLAQHIEFYSAVNTNVFVGAFASHVGRGKARVLFHEFLRENAPYADEGALSEFLERIGIGTVDLGPEDPHESSFVSLQNALELAYEEADDAILRDRAKVLVRHEAQQLHRLREDAKSGLRSLFVTAHGRLRKLLRGHRELGDLSYLTTSHVGMIAIAEMVAGGEVDSRSLARLLWTTPSTDREEALFEYFVNLGLRRYREGLSLDVSQAASAVTQEAIAAAETEGILLASTKVDDVARTARFLDRFEERFYELYRKSIDQARRLGDAGTPTGS